MSDSVGHYLNEIGMVPLLNAAEEIELAQVIEQGVDARARRDAGERGGTVPPIRLRSGSREGPVHPRQPPSRGVHRVALPRP